MPPSNARYSTDNQRDVSIEDQLRPALSSSGHLLEPCARIVGSRSRCEARSRWSLSHVHVQMARELGMNPNKLGKLAKALAPLFKIAAKSLRARLRAGCVDGLWFGFRDFDAWKSRCRRGEGCRNDPEPNRRESMEPVHGVPPVVVRGQSISLGPRHHRVEGHNFDRSSCCRSPIQVLARSASSLLAWSALPRAL